MSNFGQAVLTVGGTVVGGIIGGPFGAQLGYLLGSAGGQALFPTQLPTVKGPKLEDAKVQTSTLGAPIPWVWGTFILAGQVIWRSPFLERKVKEKSGGKGGPEQTSVHFEYRVNVAIGLCKGPIVGIRRIWADTKLIYDATADDTDDIPPDPDFGDSAIGNLLEQAIIKKAASGAAAAKFDLYLGSESQTADPTIETYEGVGNVPGYRGLAYIVFRDFELAEYGNRIPNFRVEVMTAGTISDNDLDLYSNDVLHPWQYMIDPTTKDPRNPLNHHLYGYTELGGTVTKTFDAAMADLNAASDHSDQPFICGEFPSSPDSRYIFGWGNSDVASYIRPCDPEQPFADYVAVRMTINAVRVETVCSSAVGGNDCAAWWGFLGGKYRPVHVTSGVFSGVVVATNHDESPSPWFGGVPYTSGDVERPLSDCSSLGDGNFDIWRLQSHELAVRRSLLPPDPCSGWMAVPGAPGYCVTLDGQVLPAITWTRTTGSWHVLRSYDDTGHIVLAYPLNPARPSTHPQYNDQAFWEAAYEAAVANGDIEAGLTYGVDYPQSQDYGYIGAIGGTFADPDPIPLSTIVADICEGCGLTDYDVSDLESVLVHGYALTGPCTGKDGIEPLRPFGYFDAVESEFTYKFVRRGHASVMTIDTDDLSARLAAEQRPPAITVTRAQDQELPRLVRAHFIDIERDGDPGQAEQQRQTVDSVNTADIQVPVVMPKERGQAMVDTVLFERWIGRNTYQCSLPFKYAPLEPTDCIDVLVDGTTERMRITSAETRALSVIDLTAVRDDASIYSGTDIVGENTGGSTIPEGGVPSPTELILLELPSLRAQDTDCGYYAAARGLLSGWPGAIIYRATSPSGTFRQVAWTAIAATMGVVTEDVGEDTINDSGETLTGTSPITGGIDHSTVLHVQLYSGTFESVGEDDLLAGENLIAVGDEGDWELIRFQYAVQTTDGYWELSSLLREQFGTARREIVTGDRVVLMTGPGIIRIDETASAQGVSRVIRAVTSGTSLEDAEDHYITTTCLSRPASADPAAASSTVISRSVDTPPTAPSCDDAYLVAVASPPLAEDDPWYAHEGEIARWDCTTLSWQFTTPAVGSLIYVEDEDGYVYSTGATIADLSPNFDAAGVSELLDKLGSPVHGSIAYRDASAWQLLAPGDAGKFLRSGGTGNDPSWTGVLTGGGGFASAVQENDLVITSNASFQDTDVSVHLEPGIYAFESFYETVSNATPSMTVRIAFTGTETQIAGLRSFARGTTSGSEQFSSLPYDVSYGVTATGVTTTTGTIVVTVAGDLKMQAKQNTSSGTSVTFSKGSWIRVSQLA